MAIRSSVAAGVATIAIAASGTASAVTEDVQAMVSGQSVTISAYCPGDASAPTAWYHNGARFGHENSPLQGMVRDGARWSTTFTDVRPGHWFSQAACNYKPAAGGTGSWDPPQPAVADTADGPAFDIS
ncbi:hypothetical protein [Nocardia sp. NPDC051570]|uniref:hypothetical protein n=1 Tax=Nocardia sp. NPDC051570 TaxID=3364324 RepID=UPI00378FF373